VLHALPLVDQFEMQPLKQHRVDLLRTWDINRLRAHVSHHRMSGWVCAVRRRAGEGTSASGALRFVAAAPMNSFVVLRFRYQRGR
jgi:hypothetical protein